MRAVIAAGSPVCYNEGLAEAVKDCDLFICADYGIRRAREIGAAPDIIIGDFDSALQGDLDFWGSSQAIVKRFPKMKDATDLELCIREAAARGATECAVYGATGGRADHALGNLHVLLLAELLGIKSYMTDETSTVCVIESGLRVIEANVGDTVSLIPLTEKAEGVTTNGLLYPLNRQTLCAGATLGVSNAVTSAPCSVEVEKGALAVWRVVNISDYTKS